MENLPTYYSIQEQIGEGAFSKIYKAIDTKNDKVVAIKLIKKQKVLKLMKQVRLEISLLKSLQHPNIIACYGSYEDIKYVYIILEFCERGDLSLLLKGNILNEKDVHKYFIHLVSALQYLNNRQIIHRDIKPKNILISNDDILKLTDFGFAKQINVTDMSQTICGSPLYMAPEILAASPYSTTSDLWSIGIVLFEMITGKPPYQANNIEDLKHNIQCISQFDLIDNLEVSQSFKQLLYQLLDINQSSRMSWEEFFNHPWITGYDDTNNMYLEMEKDSSVPQFSIFDHMENNVIPSQVEEEEDSEKEENETNLSFEEILQRDSHYVIVERQSDSVNIPIVQRIRSLSNSIIQYFTTLN
tara:strand:- start:1549 stop:2619 length:1071 start_codon:yes stop_codon:yes gene_type:complete